MAVPPVSIDDFALATVATRPDEAGGPPPQVLRATGQPLWSTGRRPGRSLMDELKSSGKPFEISKREVWEAYRQVKANQGAPGVDGVTLGEFEADLKNNLYRIWNRMSSGSYFPPPVKAVEIPKPHGTGTRLLGV